MKINLQVYGYFMSEFVAMANTCEKKEIRTDTCGHYFLPKILDPCILSKPCFSEHTFEYELPIVSNFPFHKCSWKGPGPQTPRLGEAGVPYLGRRASVTSVSVNSCAAFPGSVILRKIATLSEPQLSHR